MLETICSGCELGQHHTNATIEAAPPGMIGGSRCGCKGECVDGRYVPIRFEALRKSVEEFYIKQRELEAETHIIRGEN